MRIPNPVASPCPDCGEPTVVAEFALGSHRVHCGTYRANCTSARIRADAKGAHLPSRRRTTRPHLRLVS